MNIDKLVKLCDEYFKDPFVQRYAGGNYECMYCGIVMIRNHGANHSAECPVTRYAELIKE